jgi:UDP-N-acetylmuramoyl-L-alanyl-D-glutamate--2,6-diaminopimelate ligase
MSLANAIRQTSMENQPSHARTKNLGALLAGVTSAPAPAVDVVDLTLNSREVVPGGAFVALPGLRTHGIGFAAQAVNAGAAAILWEPVENVLVPALPREVPVVAVPRLSELVGDIADRFFDAPSQAMTVAGVTGTNGKTTTAYLIATALDRLGEASAYAGTLGHGRIGALNIGAHTTPDAITLQRNLAELRAAGVRFLGMEVSSHALDQHRVGGVRFDTAVFTNLTRDHLDYHGTLEAYGAAKAKLFSTPGLAHAVINMSDDFGARLMDSLPSSVQLVAYARSTPARSLPAAARMLFATEITPLPHGLLMKIDGSWGAAALTLRFIGDFNAENALAALATLLCWNVPLDRAIAALEQCSAPPGRMEMVEAAGKPLVIVDYSHTPDALEKALLAARRHCSGRLFCVFGCGGERDPGKRPLMGAVAERLSDRVIVTDDNPRGEDGERIAADILSGMSDAARAVLERDRAAAIERAVREGRAGDVVLVAGKGHEDYQIVGTVKRHFSDREVAEAALRRLV